MYVIIMTYKKELKNVLCLVLCKIGQKQSSDTAYRFGGFAESRSDSVRQ